MKQHKKRGTGTGTGPAGWLSDGKRHGKRRLVAREGAARRAELWRNGATICEAAPVDGLERAVPSIVMVARKLYCLAPYDDGEAAQAGRLASVVLGVDGTLQRAAKDADRELATAQAAGALTRVRGRESARSIMLTAGKEDTARGRFTADAVEWLATWATRRVVGDHRARGVNLGDCARDFADGAVRLGVCKLAVRHAGWFARLGQIVGRREDIAALRDAVPMGGAWGCSVSAIADSLAAVDVGKSTVYGLAVRWARRGLRDGRGLGDHLHAVACEEWLSDAELITLPEVDGPPIAAPAFDTIGEDYAARARALASSAAILPDGRRRRGALATARLAALLAAGEPLINDTAKLAGFASLQSALFCVRSRLVRDGRGAAITAQGQHDGTLDVSWACGRPAGVKVTFGQRGRGPWRGRPSRGRVIRAQRRAVAVAKVATAPAIGPRPVKGWNPWALRPITLRKAKRPAVRRVFLGDYVLPQGLSTVAHRRRVVRPARAAARHAAPAVRRWIVALGARVWRVDPAGVCVAPGTITRA